MINMLSSKVFVSHEKFTEKKKKEKRQPNIHHARIIRY